MQIYFEEGQREWTARDGAGYRPYTQRDARRFMAICSLEDEVTIGEGEKVSLMCGEQ